MGLPRNSNEIIEQIMLDEGTYVNDPKDPGGATKYGVTLATLRSYHLNPDLTAHDVEILTADEAREILLHRYLIEPGFDKIINLKLQLLVVDMWVNHGPARATKIIQTALKLTVDGIMGKNTMSYLLHGNLVTFNAILAERIRFIGRHVSAYPDKMKFLNGWLDRSADFINEN